MKPKRGFSKHVCIDKLLHKLAKNIKFDESKTTMELLQDESNMSPTTLLAKSYMRLSILTDMGVIIPDPNTMKSNDTES